MFRPNQYIRSMAPLKGAINSALKNYWKFVNVKKNCHVLEVGCGPGNLTHDILLPLFPRTLQSYIATDISRPMIEYAQAHYQNEPRLKFQLMDIATDSLPETFLAHFDHILSFQCLHFVSDHRKALENMYRMTKPGGGIFITFAGKVILFDIYEELAVKDTWSPYLKNYRQFLSPAQFCEEPHLYLETILKEVGFTPVICASREKEVDLTKNSLLTFVEAICVYPIPNGLMHTFLEEIFESMKRRKWVYGSNGNHAIFPYTLVIAYALKPYEN